MSYSTAGYVYTKVREEKERKNREKKREKKGEKKK